MWIWLLTFISIASSAVEAPTTNFSWAIDEASYRYSKNQSSLFLGGEFDSITLPINTCTKQIAEDFHKRFLAEIKRHKAPKKQIPQFSPIVMERAGQKPLVIRKGDSLGLFLTRIKLEVEKLRYAERVLCSAKAGN